MRYPGATLTAAAVVVALVVGGCTGGRSAGDEDGPVVTRSPATAVDVIDVATPASAALGVSRRLFDRSEVVIVSSSDPAVQELAERAARRLGVPMLLPGPAVPAEIERLGARTVLGIGTAPDVAGLREVEPTRAAVDAAVGDLPRAAVEPRDVVVLTRAPGPNRAAVT
ncbi:hypothetical protein, partial [Aeromicrobium sp. 50.2.37]|uniref:hypothetical protein n=1 Tax=Aeromicrobium sp. 50.2.37 TaxID=2969305 RepID=UPI00215035C5